MQFWNNKEMRLGAMFLNYGSEMYNTLKAQKLHFSNRFKKTRISSSDRSTPEMDVNIGKRNPINHPSKECGTKPSHRCVFGKWIMHHTYKHPQEKYKLGAI